MRAAQAPVIAHVAPVAGLPARFIQPVADVRLTLDTRRTQPDYQAERPLWLRLPEDVRNEVEALSDACSLVKRLVKARLSVQAAVAESLKIFAKQAATYHWKPKTFRGIYDLWVKEGDWLALVNRAKAGPEWQQRTETLPAEFIKYVASLFGSFIRADAKKEALRDLKRRWQAGRDKHGDPAPIPGYGFWQDWFRATGYRQLRMPRSPLPEIAPIPPGWSYSNIMGQIKKAAAFPKSVEALMHESIAAATAHLPQVHSGRDRGPGGQPLRFMEEIQFDDVKTDWVLFDPVTGETMDLWLLIAHDVATTCLLGFGMRPARHRPDGSQEHLKLRDTKQLLGWIFERFGLPPYTVHLKFELGTATLQPGDVAAIEELMGRFTGSIRRVICHFSKMHAGKSPVGYRERAKGNSRGKASLESHNRLMHIIGADLPGQTGPHYSVRPADLSARAKECEEIWSLGQYLPENLRGKLGFSLLDLQQARTQLQRIFAIRNHRDDHRLEGFETVIEYIDPRTGKLMPQSAFDPAIRDTLKVIRRKERPVERAARLVAPYQSEWSAVSPDIITVFYQHTCKRVPVTNAGQVEITFEGKLIRYINPGAPVAPGTWLLAYFHPDSPDFLHLTTGDGKIVGTWLREKLATDHESLQQAHQYSAAALKAAKDYAAELAAPTVAKLEAMRTANAALHAQANTIATIAAPRHGGSVRSPVAAALTAIPRKREAAAASDAADEALAASLDAAD